MGRGAGAPRIGGTPKSYQTNSPVQVQLKACFHIFGVRRLAAAFTLAAVPTKRNSSPVLHPSPISATWLPSHLGVRRLAASFTLAAVPTQPQFLRARSDLVIQAKVPRFYRARTHCHPDRSDPIFSCAPQCGASGRAVEGSAFTSCAYGCPSCRLAPSALNEGFCTGALRLVF